MVSGPVWSGTASQRQRDRGRHGLRLAPGSEADVDHRRVVAGQRGDRDRAVWRSPRPAPGADRPADAARRAAAFRHPRLPAARSGGPRARCARRPRACWRRRCRTACSTCTEPRRRANPRHDERPPRRAALALIACRGTTTSPGRCAPPGRADQRRRPPGAARRVCRTAPSRAPCRWPRRPRCRRTCSRPAGVPRPSGSCASHRRA